MKISAAKALFLAALGILGSTCLGNAQAPSLGYEGIEKQFDEDNYQGIAGSNFKAYVVDPTGVQTFCPTYDGMSCYGHYPERDWTSQILSPSILPVSPADPIQRFGAALFAYEPDAVSFIFPIQGERAPEKFTDLDWIWFYGDLPPHPGALSVHDRDGDGIVDAYSVTVDESMLTEYHPSVGNYLRTNLRRRGGSVDSGQALTPSSGVGKAIDAKVGTSEHFMNIEQFRGEYVLELERMGTVIDSIEISSPVPPFTPSVFSDESAPVERQDGYQRDMNLEVLNGQYGPEQLSVSVTRNPIPGARIDNPRSLEHIALIDARSQSLDGGCIARMEDIEGSWDEYFIDMPSESGSVTIDTRTLAPGRYAIAHIGEAEPTPTGSPTRYGEPVLDIQYFDVPAVEVNDRLVITEVFASAPASRSESDPNFATYEYQINWLGSDNPRMPETIYVEAVRPPTKLISGAYRSELVVDSVRLDEFNPSGRIRPRNFPGTYLRVRSETGACERSEGFCGYFEYGRVDLPAENSLPIPEEMLEPLRLSEEFQSARQSWPSFQAGPFQLCGQAPEKPKELYRPPAVIATAAALGPKTANGQTNLIAVRAENTGETGASDLRLAIQLSDPFDIEGLRGLRAVSEICSKKGRSFFYCELGDLDAGQSTDLFFESRVPEHGEIVWRSALDSSGDLGRPLINEGIIGAPNPLAIDAVVPFSDQLGVLGGTFSFPYPFSGQNASYDVRYLLLVGESLPRERADIEFGGSPDVVYHFAAFSDTDDPLFHPIIAKAWARYYGMSDPSEAHQRAEREGRHAILVDARLQAPALPGQKTLALNGVTSEWFLRYGDLALDTYFVRDVRGAGIERADNVYAPERVRLAVELNTALPIDNLPAKLTAFDPIVQSDVTHTLKLNKSEKYGDKLYLSQPLDLHQANALPSMDGGQAVRVAIDRDDPELMTAVLDPKFAYESLLIERGQTLASSSIYSNPTRNQYSFLWSQALARTATCHGLEGINWSSMTRKEAEEIWNVVVFTDSPLIRGVSAKYGHHAGSILLRERFLEITEEKIRQLEWVLTNEKALARLAADLTPAHLDDGNPFLRMKVKDLDGSEITLKNVLYVSEESDAEVRGISLAQVRKIRINAMRQAVANMIAATKKSRKTAYETDICDVEDMILLTGLGFDRIHRGLEADLMKLTTHYTGDGRPNQLWVPDIEARRWVRQVVPFSESVRDQQALADLDTTAITLAVTAITMPLGMVSGPTYFASVAVSATDIAFSTIYEVNAYFVRRDERDFADGAAIVIGDERFKEAEARAQNGYVAILTVGVSIFGFKNDIGHIMNATRAARGQRIATNLRSIRQARETLSRSQKADLVAFAARANARRSISGARALTSTERRTLDLFDEATSTRPSAVNNSASRAGASSDSYSFKANDDIVFDTANLQPRSRDLFDAPVNGFESRVSDGQIRFSRPDGTTGEISVGRRLGRGSTSETLDDPDDLLSVVRVTYIREGAAARKLDDFGADVLNNRVQSPHIRAAEIFEEIPVAADGVIARIVRMEKMSRTGRDLVQRQAEALLDAARTGRARFSPNTNLRAAQIDAYVEALADLNRRGYVWLDNKGDNFAFVEIPGSGGRVQLVVFDTGGIVPVSRFSAEARNLSPEALARAIQARVNGSFDRYFPDKAGLSDPVLRSAYRRKKILEEFGDAIDIDAVGLKSMDELWFNPWAGEEFSDLARFFDDVATASRSDATFKFDPFELPPSCGARAISDDPVNPFSEVLQSNAASVAKADIDRLPVDSAFGEIGTAPRPGGRFETPAMPSPQPEFTNGLEVVGRSPTGTSVTLQIEGRALGQGSTNTVYGAGGEGVLRMPGGNGGIRPSARDIQIDRGARELFERVFADAPANTLNVRLVEVKQEIILQSDKLLPTRRIEMGPVIELEAGDVLQLLERRGAFSSRMKSAHRPPEFKNRMTEPEALAYDRAHRELNKRGLVWLDNKWDNFAFEPHPNPSFPGELRLVVLDPGGLVAVRGRSADIAQNIQRHVNGAGDPAFRSQYSSIDAGDLEKFQKKRQLIIEQFGADIDVRSLGIDSDNLRDIPFNPMSVEAFPRARALSANTASEASDFYRRFKEMRTHSPIQENRCDAE